MADGSDARCIGHTETFFSERQTSIAKAKLICSSCPLKRKCLEWALEFREAWGVWAGLDYHELRIVAVSLGHEPPSREENEVAHGTERGWGWHRRKKLQDPTHETCEACHKAYNEASRLRVAKYRKNKSIDRPL